MELTTVKKHLADARGALMTAVAAERKVLADPKSSGADIAKAGPAVMVAGVLNSALERMEEDLVKTLEAGKATGVIKTLTKAKREKKAKKAKA